MISVTDIPIDQRVAVTLQPLDDFSSAVHDMVSSYPVGYDFINGDTGALYPNCLDPSSWTMVISEVMLESNTAVTLKKTATAVVGSWDRH